MELSLTYILSQVFIIINYILLVCTYQAKSRKTILILNICSLTSAGISYICLSAYTALAMAIVSIFRNVVFIINEKKNGITDKITKNEIYMLLVIYALTIILASVTYDGILSLMSVAATMLYTYSVWQKSTKLYKWLGVPVCILWVTYNIYIKSLFGIICEFILMTSAIIGLIRENIGKVK